MSRSVGFYKSFVENINRLVLKALFKKGWHHEQNSAGF